MEIRELRNALFDKLVGTGWENGLRFFVKTSDFDDIIEFLIYQVEEGRRFTPPLKDWFRPFQLCHFDQLKVVFLVPEPYQDPSLNTGLAIESKEIPRVSIEFYRLRQDLNKQYPDFIGSDLSKWATQGVFLYNTSITSQILKSGAHKKIWAPFTSYLINMLNKKDLIFVIFGETGFESQLTTNHHIIKVKTLPDHPDKTWSAENLFTRVNEQLKLKNKSQIIW